MQLWPAGSCQVIERQHIPPCFFLAARALCRVQHHASLVGKKLAENPPTGIHTISVDPPMDAILRRYGPERASAPPLPCWLTQHEKAPPTGVPLGRCVDVHVREPVENRTNMNMKASEWRFHGVYIPQQAFVSVEQAAVSKQPSTLRHPRHRATVAKAVLDDHHPPIRRGRYAACEASRDLLSFSLVPSKVRMDR